MTNEQKKLMAELEALKAENARLKAENNKPLTLKVSKKGAFSIYGLGRFPVTLYAKQWRKVLADAERITKFIDDNEAEANAVQEAHLAGVEAEKKAA